MKSDTEIWNEEEFGDIKESKLTLKQDIHLLDVKEEEASILMSEYRNRSDELKNELGKCALMEEISWTQKSRAVWLKGGDTNTKFFHRLTNSHRRNNHIEQLEVEGKITTGDMVINE